jgi:hypothetical protein
VVSASSTNIVGTVSYFTNPYSVLTFGAITVEHISGCRMGSTAVSSDKTYFSNSFTVGILTTYSLSTTPDTVGYESAAFTVSVTKATTLRAKGIIQLLFPSWYTVGTSDSTVYMFNTGSVSCSSSTVTITSTGCQFSSKGLNITYSGYSSGPIEVTL